MKVSIISYSKTFPRAQYGINDRIGIEVEREDGDTPEDCFAYAKELVEKFNSDIVANQPPAQVSEETEYRGMTEKIITPAAIENRVDEIAKDIGTCTSIKVLETYRFIMKTDPKLETAYNLKMSQLTINK
jgi:hypothetical protein